MTTRPEPITPLTSPHWPALALAVLLMLGATLMPILFADADGRADHRLALLVFWAMSAGFVRGVGFVPRHPLPRILLSAWAAGFALALAAAHVLYR